MTGSVQLRSQKGLLTRYSNILHQAISKYSDRIDTESSPRLLTEMSSEINADLKLVSEALENFTKSVDQINEPQSEEERKQVEEYVEKAHVLLEKAHTLGTKIHAKLMGLEAQSESSREMKSAKVELPTIPIPTFGGRITEFENFWALFSANVHSQRLSNLQKFNYLLRSLKGEAKEAIRRYSVTEENYNAAIEVLHAKFGDKSKLIHELQVRLERATASGTHISDQRRLLEYLLALTTQLEQKGVSLNGSFITQKVLAKFKQSLQRKVLQQHVEADHQEEDWSVSRLLIDLDKLIRAEEKVNEMLTSNEASQNKTRPTYGQRQFEKAPGRPISCIYCNGTEHVSQTCNKIASIEERTQFLMKNKFCLNCAKPNHLLKDCSSRGCNMCEGKKHHSTICHKRQTKGKFMSQMKSNTTESANRARHTKQDLRKSNQNQNHVTEIAKITSTSLQSTEQDSNKNTTSTLYVSNTEQLKNTNQVLFLTGMAKICDKRSGQLKKAETLFDTGADRSFITETVAVADQKCINEKKTPVKRRIVPATPDCKDVPIRNEEDTSTLNVSNHQNSIDYGKILSFNDVATVANQETGHFKEVRVPSDTDTDGPFINGILAEELKLQTKDPVHLSVYTTGSSNPTEEKFDFTSLEVLGLQEKPLQLLDDIFQEQPTKGITEEIAGSKNKNLTLARHLPHQSVITPSKEITKPYAAIDSFYQVVLYGMLLKPQMEKPVINAIAGTAIFQLRLNEDNRSAPRVDNNVILSKSYHSARYCFIIVLFKLSSSTFLLEITIGRHVEYEEDKLALTSKFCDNLYLYHLKLLGDIGIT